MNPILILGARIIDGRPSRVLVSRLRYALPLIDAADTVVLSGAGEAYSMRDWLVEHGADRGKLVVEPSATSTNENLEHAHAQFPGTARWTVVTSDFHVLRTRVWAWHLGIPVEVRGARTPGVWRLKMFLRECVALPHSTLRVLWRRFRACDIKIP